MDLTSLLIAILIIAVVLWGVWKLSPLLPYPASLILQVLVTVIVCIYLIKLLAPMLSGVL